MAELDDALVNYLTDKYSESNGHNEDDAKQMDDLPDRYIHLNI